MKLLINTFLTFLLVLVACANAIAADEVKINQSMWKHIGKEAKVIEKLIGKQSATLLKTRLFELDLDNFKTRTADASNLKNALFASRNAVINTDQVITLPLPDGSKIDVKITPSTIMPDSLAKKFPKIKTWDVEGVNGDVTGTVDFTHRGFHGMLIMPDGDKVFIEPDFENPAQGRYLSFSQKDNDESFTNEFSCGVHTEGFTSPVDFAAKGTLLARPASDLITYKLAVAATAEYTEFHGGTVESALSAIVTTISRVNQIYKRDLNIQFELVDEQADIIYLDANTDPYSNYNVGNLLEENDENLSSLGVLSKDQYDIGHVFATGNFGGLAQVGSVCNTTYKAQGATGISSPIGDAFSLDFVAHELGHQMGASHTFNSACGTERSAITAVEPGSGTTIMSYAGICQANDIQSKVDGFFHIVSIDQITNHSLNGGGSQCGIRTSTNNENPTVTAGDDFTVPARTPVVFTAEGEDRDGDVLSYTWDQTNAGTVSDVNVDTGDNALFRSLPASASANRFIPNLSDLFNGRVSDGELLAVNSRNIEMVVAARDEKGGLQADLVNMTVSDTGESFRVTSHTTDQRFFQGDQTNIMWNVAATNSSPIACSSVDIGLITVDGNGIDILTTPNDGQQQITIPSDLESMSNARFIVSCNSSGFFNVSHGCITIGNTNEVCNGGGNVILDRNAIDGDGVPNITATTSSGGGNFNLLIISLCSLLLVRRRYC